MSCRLSDGELFVLNYLCAKRNLSSKRGQHCKKIEGVFEIKYSQKIKFEKVIKTFLNGGYISKIPKKTGDKYYISNIPITSFALRSHDYSVVNGRVRPL
ncbi:MAG: hypothetical protein M8350_07175 [Methanosarcinaceae archaeon]|nr:hypothetical protein [Methanosarcinaceae archaeon]